MATIEATEFEATDELSHSEASAAEIISKMSEYQYIAVVQDCNTCEPMEQIINEKGEAVAANTTEYYQTVGDPVDLGFANEEISTVSVSTTEDIQNIIEEGVNIAQEPSDFVIDSSQDTLVDPSAINIISDDKVVKAQTSREDDLKLRTLLLPLGMKFPNSQGHNKEKRKRVKSSLFIGYTAEAAEVLKDFETLKTELNIKSNIEMLKKLIQVKRTEYSNSAETYEPGSEALEDNEKRAQAFLQLISNSNNSQHESNPTGDCSLILQDQVAVNLINTVEQASNQNDVTNVLGLTALNIKTIQLSKKYLEHVTKDGFYISGFVDCSERLDEFLKLFRLITGSSFSIRRSKVKINDDPDPEEKPLRKYKPGYLGKGQIKWEKNIGVPPIPFTGIPFTTEGSTTYQCIYGPKRVKGNGNNDQNTDDETPQAATSHVAKRRRTSRESKKKDCPAQIHIRTVHRFPTYSCINSNRSSIVTLGTYVNKCQRGIILAKLREDITNEKVQGEQGFWVRLPLPEVHENHSLGPFDGCETPLNEEMILEMKNILQNAAITS